MDKSHTFVDNLGEWMTQLPSNLRKMPIINLAIPGSHDSMSFGIRRKASVAPDAEPVINHVYKVAPCIVRRWARTQEIDATQQLGVGVRYFDLRFSLKRQDKRFYFVHGLYAEIIQKPFDAIKAFLDAHPKEFVVFDCQHFYDFEHMDFMRLANEIRESFGDRIFRRSDGTLDKLSLDGAERRGKQVLVIFRHEHYVPDEFWPSNAWPTPWPNQIRVIKLKQYLERTLPMRPKRSGYVSQCVLTPPVHFILPRVYSSLRQTCAETVRRKMFKWIAAQQPGPSEHGPEAKINVLIADFVNLNDNEFCKLVVGLNVKLTDEFVDIELSPDATTKK